MRFAILLEMLFISAMPYSHWFQYYQGIEAVSASYEYDEAIAVRSYAEYKRKAYIVWKDILWCDIE